VPSKLSAVSPSPQSSTALIRRLLRDHVRPHAGRLLLAVGCMVVVASMTAANAWLMEPALDKVFVQHDRTWLLLAPALVLLVAVVKGVAGYFDNTIMSDVGQRIIADTQVRLYARLIRADLAWLQRVHSGKLVSAFLYDATLLRDAVSRALTGMARDALSLTFLAGVMFYQHWLMAACAVLVFPLVALASRNLGRRARKGSARGQEETGRLTALLNETLEGARLVKAYGMEGHETARASASVEARLKHLMRVVRARAAAAPAIEALGGVAVALAILVGGWQAAAGQMTLGAFASFITALLLAYQPLKSLANLNAALQEGLAAAERLFATLDVAPAITDAPDAKPLRISGGEISFARVSFAYDNGPPALHDVSFTAAAGRRIALVGPSGAGKSTILNLIPRFFDAQSGVVAIDGQDVKAVTQASLRQAIALVSQELTLFDDTVTANIAYGRPGASAAEIAAAARAADAHDFIARLPQGYDTPVGENGVKLSGGQRQRIAIARAMLRDAPILLLDEATSALDAEAEHKVQQALRRLMQGRTTIVIAHRLSTVLDADDILVIDGGRVVESGRHGELLARGGVYARLYATQFAAGGATHAPPRAAAGVGE
jgi:ATP-binding cassette, subfamily B, bacterial MsbA